MQKSKAMFLLGFVIALTAAGLLLFDNTDSGYPTVIGFLGIGLIATSGYRPLGKK